MNNLHQRSGLKGTRSWVQATLLLLAVLQMSSAADIPPNPLATADQKAFEAAYLRRFSDH